MSIIQKLIELLKKIFFQKYSPSPRTPEPSPEPSNEVVLPSVSSGHSIATPSLSDIPENIEMLLNVEQLKQIIPKLSDIKRREYLPYLHRTMHEFEINTPLRVCAFIAQTAHESVGYSAFLENLNYSAEALLRTWPSRFAQENVAFYARQPQKIANRAYSNRLGNGDEASGDGWRYRGRGVIQTTGHINYKACGIGLDLDLVTFPELLEQPLNAFRSAGWYWKSHNCNSFADSGDFIGLTKAINGGLNGLDDRKVYYGRAKSVLGIA